MGNTGTNIKYFKNITVTSVNELLNQKLSVYPNPSQGLFTIDLSNENVKIQNSTIAITDITGKIILNLSNIDIQNFTKIDLSNHAKGVYFIKFKNEELVSISKIILK